MQNPSSDLVQKCPQCNGPMVKRNRKSDGKPFWGCKSFPKCKGILPFSEGWDKVVQVRPLKTIDHPTEEQKQIFLAVETLIHKGNYNGHQHLIGTAGAGTGKTTTEEHVVGLIKKHQPSASIKYLVFNKRVEVEAREKGLPAQTTHSKFFADYRKWFGNGSLKVDDNKVANILSTILDKMYPDKEQRKTANWLFSPVCSLVSKVKNTCAPTDDDTLIKLADRFAVELNGSEDVIFNLVREVIKQSDEMLNVLDFDDMLRMVWLHKIPVEQYDWVLGDEIQDWNRCQIELIKRSVKKEGHLLGVGDRNQSIYGFRGADLESMDNLKDAMKAIELPLSVSFRCAKSHASLVNQLFPHIKFSAFEKNQEGLIEQMSSNKMLGELKEGDLVICRVNAELVRPAFELIRQGRKAIILGRDIGKGLIALVDKFDKPKVDDLLDVMSEYAAKEIAKLIARNKTNQAASLDDRIKTIFALSDSCDWTWQLKQRIEEVFSDEKEGIVFSTVHKIKGGEADNVYILKPQLFPHPMAQRDWEIRQEFNCAYVALTRAKSRLVFVDGPAPAVFEVDMWEEYNVIAENWEELEDIQNQVYEQLKERLPEGSEVFKDDEKEVELITQPKNEKWAMPIIEKCPF